MLRNPRVWFYVAGGWLLVAGVAHLAAHTWAFVFENGMVGRWEFAMNAMRQARSPDPLAPSLWRLFRSFSASFGLLLLFAGAVDVVLAWTDAPPRTLRTFALLGTVFWALAFILFAFIDPVLQPILVAVVAVPLHSIAFVATNEHMRTS